MFLLFLELFFPMFTFTPFTFQYVSIISDSGNGKSKTNYQFTFQYVSIISYTFLPEQEDINHLHSNMFLLFQIENNSNKILQW